MVTMSEMPSMDPETIVRTEGRAGRITLNRPKALNALTYAQVGIIDQALDAWCDDPAIELVILDGAGDRALCAGGDVMAMYDSRNSGTAYAYRFWREEYHLNLKIARYPKPYVALMDGIVMGGGIGLSGHASHRIVTERSMLAMPETGIGLVPDVGGMWLLANAPGHMGEYLGLLGERMGSADAIYAGFADTHVDADRLGDLVEVLCARDGEPVGVTIAEFAGTPTGLVHAGRQAEIDAIFSAPTMPQVRDRLAASSADWAGKALGTLSQRSPLSLGLTLAAVREARARGSLADALDIEFRLTTRLYVHGEFIEGIRALLVDKDKAPKWNPATLEAVTPDMTAKFLAPLPATDELGLGAARRT
jgi:enoyl-CoA hydratase/carnithine racemase